MKVSVNDFIARYCDGDEYRHGLYVPEDTQRQIRQCAVFGKQFCEVSDNTFELIEAAKNREEQRDRCYNDVSALRLAGMKAESDDDISAAIQRYSEAIELGEASDFDLLHAYRHAYDRIIILLSRTHAHDREAEYIEQLLKRHKLQDSDRKRLEERLRKVYMKISK